MADSPQAPTTQQPRTFAEFLEASPPDAIAGVSELYTFKGTTSVLQEPDLQLHCSSETCNGLRIFHCTSDTRYVGTDWTFVFVLYRCRNCETTGKTYALALRIDEKNPGSGLVQKLGEVPLFGPPVPARVISLIGPDRELFLRGRRSENHGLGIGAFAYYRRVVENQKGRIIEGIGRVAERLGADKPTLESFSQASKQTQFSKAIDQVKSGIPKSLLIEGQNPLSLLHTALSQGLHDRSDEDCLVLATSIRLVLTDLAERMSQALKDDAELKDAVARLLQRQTAKEKANDQPPKA